MTAGGPTNKPRWSATLDVGEPVAISVASPGMVVVAGTRAAIAHDTRGVQQWRLGGCFVAAQALPDGRTVLRGTSDVRVVDMVGETLTRWSSTGYWAPAPLDRERFIDLDNRGGLMCTAASGEVSWRVDLECWSLFRPAVARTEIVVSDADGLRTFDDRGQPQFRVGLGAARSGSSGLAAAEGPIFAFDGGYLAYVRKATAGSSWYFWRPVHGEIAPFAAGAAAWGPACVAVGGGNELFVAVGVDTSETNKQIVRAFAPSGEVVWKLETLRVVNAIGGLADGQVALVCAPTINRWEKYRTFVRVEDECRLLIVDRDGKVRRNVALESPPAAAAAHAEGRVYVLRQDQLLVWDVDRPS